MMATPYNGPDTTGGATYSNSGNVVYIRNDYYEEDTVQDDDREELRQLHREDCRVAWPTFPEIRKATCPVVRLDLFSRPTRHVRHRQRAWTGKNYCRRAS